MDYKAKSVELLNKAIAMEMTGLHQYMYFHFRLEDMGYDPLAALFHRLGIVEMRHVEEMAERILFLKGEVELVMQKPVKKIHDVKEMLAYATKLESDTVAAYNDFAKQCSENGDAATKKLFEDLIVVEEEHEDMFDTEHGNLSQFGDQFLALQSYSHSKNIAKKE